MARKSISFPMLIMKNMEMSSQQKSIRGFFVNKFIKTGSLLNKKRRERLKIWQHIVHKKPDWSLFIALFMYFRWYNSSTSSYVSSPSFQEVKAVLSSREMVTSIYDMGKKLKR